MKLKNEQFSQKFQQVFKNEKDEILQAAEETIKTLTEMLESKKSQLVVKERQIEKMRQEQLEQKEAHTLRVMDLENQVYNKGTSTLAKLHEYVEGHVGGAERAGLLDERAQAQQRAKESYHELTKA
jgi:chaperonin GroEL (HSP60 family)